MTIDPDVVKALDNFYLNKKPIAACCISPIILAKHFGKNGVKLTLGKKGEKEKWPYGDSIDVAK